MKQKFLLMFLLAGMFYTTVKANESEPNDTKATADVLTLNGSNTGSIGTSTDVDWWQVTTTGDGKLDATINVSNGLNLWCEIYDNDGTTLLAADYTTALKTVSKDGLAAGIYYLKLRPYFVGQMPDYTISNALTVPAQANDAEPNGTRALAKVLPLNSSKTGHSNYYYNLTKDTTDWYKVTTNADGRLRLTMSSANGQNVWAYLYDNDGTTLLASGYTAGTAVVVNKDGLAAGTYYIRVNTFYNSEFAPYTISDSLFTPTEPNDAEPDSTRALALTLPLNGSKQGHINYYYDKHKDSVDWYMVKTNADGRLRLTMSSGNGQNVWAYLFDNDGTTLLASGYTAGTAVVVNKDGLAAGTYYIRVNTFYTSEWAPYTLSDSLFKPIQANDAELNNSKAAALVLPLNGSTTGHTNYYYNLVKDTADWYQLTTNADGMITVNIQSHNGQNVWAYLFDNDGTTQLNATYTTNSASYTYDGLKAGTYYIRVNTYYSSEFAPYTLSNTLTTYANAPDAEPNDYFSQAQTMPSNSTSTGHVNFYYNGVSDAVDYHKINYTGSGNLTLVFNQENRLQYGNATPTWFQVYKDTALAPIFSNYFYSTSGNINLTALATGYYYIKVFTYYNGRGNHFSSYSITNTYTQVAPKITVSYDTIALACSPVNKITVKIKNSGSSTVQLYRYGAAYGSPVIMGKTTSFKNLPIGNYYVTAAADGATGGLISISKTLNVIPKPFNANTTAITSTQATLNWTTISCARYYSIQYRVHGTLAWSLKKTNTNIGSFVLNGLTPSTTYDWEVASVDTLNGIKATSLYTDSVVFTTAASLIAVNNYNEENLSVNGNTKNQLSTLTISPNPATSFFTIHYNNSIKQNVNAQLFDVNGKAVWSSGLMSAESLNGKQVHVSQFAKGVFYLKIINENGIVTGTTKVIISQ